MDEIFEECFDKWLASKKVYKIIWPPKGKLIDIPYSSRERKNYSPKILLKHPGTDWWDWVDYLDKVFYFKEQPLPITWPPNKTLGEALFSDKSYRGLPRTGATWNWW